MASSNPELWQVIIPTWLGGVGGILSAAIAGVALTVSWKARTGVHTVAQGLNAPRETESSVAGWAVEPQDSRKFLFRNLADHEVSLEAFTTITESDDPVGYAFKVPVIVAAGATLPFFIEKSLASAMVTVLEAVWIDRDVSHSARFYI